MAKSKEQKYNEAIERNLKTAETEKISLYWNLGEYQIKLALGIKKGDTRFDSRIKAIMKLKG